MLLLVRPCITHLSRRASSFNHILLTTYNCMIDLVQFISKIYFFKSNDVARIIYFLKKYKVCKYRLYELRANKSKEMSQHNNLASIQELKDCLY